MTERGHIERERERERERPCGCIAREKGKAAEGCFGGAERVGGVLDE